MRRVFSYLSHIIFPQHCPACGRLAVPYCPDCLSGSAKEALPPFCADCGGAYGVECCYDSVPCYAAAIHDGDARSFILALKYKNMRPLGEAIGREMGRLFPRQEADLLIPLPLHADSRRAFNQTELIARGISSQWGTPVGTRLLKCRAGSGEQTEKRGRARRALSFDSFVASPELTGKSAVLVDDVYTTGGTVRAAKFALQRAGAEVKAVIVWTRRVSSLNITERGRKMGNIGYEQSLL